METRISQHGGHGVLKTDSIFWMPNFSAPNSNPFSVSSQFSVVNTIS